MDSSLQNTKHAADEPDESAAEDQKVERVEEEKQHIHLPNPSLWPLILSVAILVTVIGLLFIPDNPWISVIGAPFILVGIMGWALEDPMAQRKAKYVSVPAGVQPEFVIDQDVVDKNQHRIGTVQARFSRYLLVERGGLFVTAYYVPRSAVEAAGNDGVIHLSMSEAELRAGGYDRVPDDLYEEPVDSGIMKVTGTPLFARGPLSPAETGHYNYGPNYPGINTDASGSYHREEVVPAPQNYVGERRKKPSTRNPLLEESYATSTTIPPRATSPD